MDTYEKYTTGYCTFFLTLRESKNTGFDTFVLIYPDQTKYKGK